MLIDLADHQDPRGKETARFFYRKHILRESYTKLVGSCYKTSRRERFGEFTGPYHIRCNGCGTEVRLWKHR
jgi:hypothetical protein